MNKLKFAILGCGRISVNHINAINKFFDYATITDLCDINPSALEEKKKLIPFANAYLSIEELLTNSKADIIAIATPSGLHPEHTIKCSNSGFNVICEKPMGVDINSALEMIKTCKKNNTKLFVVKQNRFNATISVLKKAINENRFGKIYMVVSNVFWTRPQEYYDSAAWRGTWAMDGGAFLNQATHYFDLLYYLFGNIDEVFSYTATMARNIEAEDTGLVSLKWLNGILGSINVTMLTYPKNLEGSITVLGENGTVKVSGVALNKIEVWDFKSKEDNKILSANYETTSVYGFGHELFYKSVIDTINNNKKIEIDGVEGIKSLELILSAYKSSKEHKPIKLPLINYEELK
jgi:UDP-N-acetyl-2-amino-2-deoxyglucuronate dehydrogenase